MLIIKSAQLPRRSRVVLFVGALFAVYTLMVFFVGMVVHREGTVASVVKPWISGNANTLGNYLQGLAAAPKDLRIDVKFRHLEKLRAQRDRALTEGVLFSDSDDYVPAAVTYGDDTVRVRIRLKGDGIDHLLHDKWSFRINVRGGDTLWGMKQLSLHHPKTRNYIFEWLYHRALRREGVIALRYEFVEVVLNGKSLGVYAMEEHFEKRLLEHNRRREGPIVRFDEDAMWRELAEQVRSFPGAERGQSGSYLSSKIDAFQSSGLLSTPLTTKQYAKMVQLLESFRRGTLPTSDVFDTELLAKYFAIVDLMGAEHSSNWHNIRFYYNTVTTRLEPIGFDANGGRPIARLVGAEWQEVRRRADASRRAESFRGQLFSDPLLRRSYVRQLERISREDYLDELLAIVSKEMKAALAILYREWPHAPWGNLDVLRNNQEYIRSMLRPAQVISACLKSTESGKITLEVGNLQGFSVAVIGMVLPNSGGRLAPLTPVLLDGKLPEQVVRYQIAHFSLPTEVEWDHALALQCQLAYRVDGTQTERLEPLTPFSVLGSVRFTHDLLRQSPNIHQFEFAEVDRKLRRITIKSGRWSIHTDVVVPAGYMLTMGPDTTLDLTERALLLSYSPLEWRGTAERPIVVTSSDGSGQGVVVMGAGAPSRLAHVRFEKLAFPKRDAWSLTGSLTFYESPLEVENCTFVDNHSEDGLNVIRSRFALNQCLFERSASDAFDADFCQGSIDDTRFVDIGNDAIDVSGSEVSVRRVTVDGSGDKAISCGEASIVTAEELDIRNAIIGLASKDHSELTVTGAILRGCTYPVAAFQKKSEFGPARLNAIDVEIIAPKKRSLVQTGSTVMLNGVRVESRPLNIDKILYGQEKHSGF